MSSKLLKGKPGISTLIPNQIARR